MDLHKNILQIFLSICLILTNNSITEKTINYLFQNVGIAMFLLTVLINLISFIGLILLIYFTFKMLFNLNNKR